MKNIFFILSAFLSFSFANAQVNLKTTSTAKIYKSDLPVIYITKNVNLHFRAPEPVQFVDLSTKPLVGDLPAENVVRIKVQHKQEETRFEVIKRVEEIQSNAKKQMDGKSPAVPKFKTVFDTVEVKNDVEVEFSDSQELGIVTIVGQSFMAQYKVIYKDENYGGNVVTNIEISPNDMQPLEYPTYEISNYELKQHAMTLISKKPEKPKRQKKDLKLVSSLNNIYSLGDYVFLDITFLNESNLPYDIDQLKFTIDDKKVYKSTNVQSIEITPLYQLYNNKKFKKSYRNIYVFKKFTYPNNKLLNVRLIEDQISGRTINLEIKYSDILQADTF